MALEKPVLQPAQVSSWTGHEKPAARPPWYIRLVLVILGIAAWHWSQSLIGARPSGEGTIGDGVHILSASWNRYLNGHPACANGLLAVSSAVIDLLSIFLLGWSIVGPSFRPFLGLLILFVMRQLCQALCALPPPDGMIWRDPGFPSLLVTYQVHNDLFFSGHTGITVLGAIELARLGRKWLVWLGTATAVGEIVTVLVLRAHYTMDVFTGAIAAFFAAGVAARIAPACDRMMSRVVRRNG